MAPHQNLKICFTEDPVKRMKREDTEMEKIFANYIFNKGLVDRIYKDTQNKSKKYRQSN